ncbi:hypothetical protein KSAC_20950 [Komagataeibacter saccharivorans]|nr:hypothetical protein KSAC_20950 [Komagataeibacter saccharivorans]
MAEPLLRHPGGAGSLNLVFRACVDPASHAA